jgi:hypothetical protein
MADNPARYANQRLIKASGVDSDAEPVAGVAAFAVAAEHVFAPIAGSGAGAVVLPAVFLRRWLFVVPAAGGPGLAFVEDSGVPGLAWLGAFAAVAGISGLVSGCQYLERQGARQAEGLWGGQRWSDEQRCSLHRKTDYEQNCSLRPRAGYEPRRLLVQVQLQNSKVYERLSESVC